MQKAAWEEACRAAKAAFSTPLDECEELILPNPPLNPDQRGAGRTILKGVRLAARANVGDASGVETDQTVLIDIGTMVNGGAGVGKSSVLSCLLEIIDFENLGTVVCTAYTGVATLQLPEGSRRATLCWLLALFGSGMNSAKYLP